MNKNGKQNKLIGIVLLVAAVIAIYFLVIQPSGGILPQSEGDIVNGYWDEAQNACVPKKGIDISQPFSTNFDETFYQCCFNQAKQQVDCNEPSELLGTFAIYQGQPNLFYVAHGVKVKNIGNIEISTAWIDSAVWTPTHTELTTAYAGIVGSIYGKGPICLVTGCDEVAWSTGQIDLQTIGGTGSPTTYGLSLVTKGSATDITDPFSVTKSASITVQKEVIGFSVVINLGA